MLSDPQTWITVLEAAAMLLTLGAVIARIVTGLTPPREGGR